MSEPLHAVMFDMDGLLVDTEPVWYEVETEIMTRLGGSWSHADQAVLAGGSLARSVAYLLSKATRAVPPATVGHWMVGEMVARIKDRGVGLMPGAAELLAEVAAEGLPCALVTSSQREVMDAVLAQLGAAGSVLRVTVCAADITRAKPDPEPYLLAAARLGMEPGRCVVLEDAPNGVVSAEAAGCHVVVVPGVARVTPAPGRTVLTSLHDVSVRLLREVAARR